MGDIDFEPPIRKFQAKNNIVDSAVNKFLGWRLPDTFSPDHYISFDKESAIKLRDRTNGTAWPIGTNLLTAIEAKAMFEYCIPNLTKQEAAIAKLKDERDKSVYAEYMAHERESILRVKRDKLRADVRMLREALKEIEWSNQTQWQSDRAKFALAATTEYEEKE